MLIFDNCFLCGQATKRNQDICVKCELELPWITKSCRICGQVIDYKENTPCGGCLKIKPPFDKTIAPFYYQEPISTFITALKFANKLIYAKILGELLATKIISHYNELYKLPEVIIPVPLHNKRLRERGYNQALEMARPIAKKLKIGIDLKSYYRIKYTTPQTSLKLDKREQNLHNAFIIKRHLHHKHVAIIDDVVTTGSTVKELSKIAKNDGVNIVDIWCCARTGL